MAFKLAGGLAWPRPCRDAAPVLLEPVMNVEVIAPEESMGDIMGDLSGRRGRPQGSESMGEMHAIRAQVPLAEMLTYAPQLRSMTGGPGLVHHGVRPLRRGALAPGRQDRRRGQGPQEGGVTARSAHTPRESSCSGPAFVGRFAQRRPTPAAGSLSPSAPPLGGCDEEVYDHYTAGMALLAAGNPAQAVVRLEKARRGAPGKASVREALGRAYFELGRLREAETEFRAVIEMAPADDYAHFCLARVLQRRGRFDEAAGHSKLARAMRPGDPRYTDPPFPPRDPADF